MTIDDLVALARQMHVNYAIDLGAASTREQRNAFWRDVISAAHYGHPIFNRTPDPQWHLKDGGGGRPQSDDVAVSMPTRAAWDCIPGAGAGTYDPHGDNRDGAGQRVPGYRFEAHAIGFLGPEQNVYAPPKPGGVVPPAIVPAPAPAPKLKSRDLFYAELQQVNRFYESADGLQRPGGMIIHGRADVEALGSWGYDLMTGKTPEQCEVEIRLSDEYKQKHKG